MLTRLLARDEIETIWTIDRSEVHHHVYRVQHGELVLTPAYFNIPGWAPGMAEEETPRLHACFDRGGAFLGTFDHDHLVGAAVVDTGPLGEARDQVQLRELYVSRAYRGQGVGTHLFEAARHVARAQGARFLYISATPTENTVNFYLGRGCVLADPPNPDLFALEPDDIHLLCAV